MLFTSYRFVFFILILFIVYYIIPKRFQWVLLLAASYLFYSFAGLKYLIYIVATTVTTYLISRRLNLIQTVQVLYLNEHKASMDREERKAYKARIKRKQRRLMILCMVFNFGILAVMKYTDFMIMNVNGLFRLFHAKQLSLIGFVLPLGISFYTFQTMGYLIDVYREKYPYEKNIAKLALFISFFPQLLQGPISRFDDLSQTLYSEHPFSFKNISFGLQRILWGYFKKLVIADRMLIAVNTIVKNPEQYQGTFVLVGMFFYAITLYADFTGGIDITIGVAEVLGIRIQENFLRPYFSKSIAEYWRRWHISLSSWFREYMFYPISVSKAMLNLSRSCKRKVGDWLGRRVAIYIASVIVWFVTGIWHGAAWNFIVWGLGNCLVILISQECNPLYDKFHAKFHVKQFVWYRLFEVVRTFWLMSFLRAFDCYRDVGTTFRMIGTIFTRINLRELLQGGLMQLGLGPADYLVLTISVLILLTASLLGRSGSVRELLAQKPLSLRYASCILLMISILIFGAYGVGYDASQFIYSQF
jgi:D-alanyl-lipoteichoic acid acyltransferase DltB (MBOAT superfamily)